MIVEIVAYFFRVVQWIDGGVLNRRSVVQTSAGGLGSFVEFFVYIYLVLLRHQAVSFSKTGSLRYFMSFAIVLLYVLRNWTFRRTYLSSMLYFIAKKKFFTNFCTTLRESIRKSIILTQIDSAHKTCNFLLTSTNY